MTSLNRVILTGKVLYPPRPHYRPDGSPVLQFPLELDDSEDRILPIQRGPDSGQTGYGTRSRKGGGTRINIVAIGKLANFKLDLLQTGQRLMVVGKLHQRRWQTPEGRNQTRTEVVATELRALGEKGHI
ncbi:MAG: single-stranded DNA-binding protein [Syntrophaceae bacterium]|nr:single-stranded DNA-binding protein [Syntrophaceae bacterium]